jgi:hypothetical protein
MICVANGSFALSKISILINVIVCVVSRWKSGSTIIQVDVGKEKAEASFLLSLPPRLLVGPCSTLTYTTTALSLLYFLKHS